MLTDGDLGRFESKQSVTFSLAARLFKAFVNQEESECTHYLYNGEFSVVRLMVKENCYYNYSDFI